MSATSAPPPPTRSSCTTRSSWHQDGGAAVRGGQVSMVRVASFAPGAAEPTVPDGRIHHWVGAVFIPGVTLDHVLRVPARPRRPRIGGVRRRAELEAHRARRRSPARLHEAAPRERHYRHLQHRARRRIPPARPRRARRAAAWRRRSPSSKVPARRRNARSPSATTTASCGGSMPTGATSKSTGA